MTLTLASPVSAIDGRLAARRVGQRDKGPPAAEVLRDGLAITTVRDLLHHYPRRYIDRSSVAQIASLQAGAVATVIGRVRRVAQRRTRQGRSMVTVTLYDGTGMLDMAFFNQPWTASHYREGMELAVSGTVGIYRGRLQVQKQEVEVLRDGTDTVHTGRITPVHPATEGITTRTIRELVWRSLERLPAIDDPLPEDLVAGEGLSSYDLALRSIHFPASDADLDSALERLKFDELFTLELGVAFRRARMRAETVGVAHDVAGPLADRLAATLPFVPTGAQRRAMAGVDAAMGESHPMNVLLQGDVGSGKTLVAVHAALVAVQSGHQAAVMAPTEVLAGQHLRSMAALLDATGARPFLDAARSDDARQSSLFDDGDAVPPAAADGLDATAGRTTLTYGVLSASVTGRDRARMVQAIADGGVDVVVGTHALVQEGIAFKDLSLAVIDEQHRFGVHQRMALKGKGVEPDVLIMTATPIPRTLALTYYGDLDVIVLDEMPTGRRPPETRIVRTGAERRSAYRLVRDEVAAGRQAFIVCAAIDEGNRAEVRAAEQEASRLASDVFPDLRVDLLHGRLRPAEKERRMEAFRSGESDVLISTTVIEVGVDVPNATVMLVENAERFGLAQLHQLRGRIGRAEHPSFCFLVDESTGDAEEARSRLEAMVRTSDGFELADADLRLRGEGTLFDVRQSGMPDLKLARLAVDLPLVRRARARAFAVIEEDARLERHPVLLTELRSRFERSIEWLFQT